MRPKVSEQSQLDNFPPGILVACIFHACLPTVFHSCCTRLIPERPTMGGVTGGSDSAARNDSTVEVLLLCRRVYCERVHNSSSDMIVGRVRIVEPDYCGIKGACR